jgi:proline iminopeptidase
MNSVLCCFDCESLNMTRRTLYPPIEPYQTGMMKVSDLHTIYYEVSGNPAGIPIVVNHGGPGGGSDPSMRQFFDPQHYRIVVYDQRGCGKSTPNAELRDNTTWDLVRDLEQLRELLQINRWIVFGGSWGSTISLAYAQTHPDRVAGLILRGIFMLRHKELQWYYQEGASFIFPDYWEKYLKPIPEDERHDLIAAFRKRLTGDDEAVKKEAALAWTVWELSTSLLFTDPAHIAKAERDDQFAIQFARIENHYFVNKGFFETDDQLLANANKIKHIPTVIVQGRSASHESSMIAC